LPCDCDGAGCKVATDAVSAQSPGGDQRRAAAAEEIRHALAGVARRLNDAFKQGQGLLRGPCDALARHGRQERYIPYIRQHRSVAVEVQSPAPRVLVRPAGLVVIQPVGSVGAASLCVESVSAQSAGVHENRVVLAAEPARGDAPRAVVPDDFIQEVLRAEQVVQHDAKVVSGAPVSVQIKRAVFGKQSSALFHPRQHECEIAAQSVGPAVVVRTVARIRCERFAGLLSRGLATGGRTARLIGEKGRVEINEIAAAVGQLLHEGEVVAGVKRVGAEGVRSATGSSRHQSKFD